MHIINLTITHGVVPNELKIACVVPIFKAGDQNLLTNYRPVLILPCFSTFLERVIVYSHTCLYQHLQNLDQTRSHHEPNHGLVHGSKKKVLKKNHHEIMIHRK